MLNVDAKKTLVLLHINICLRVDRLKVNYKKYSKEHKQLGINSYNQQFMQQRRL